MRTPLYEIQLELAHGTCHRPSRQSVPSASVLGIQQAEAAYHHHERAKHQCVGHGPQKLSPAPENAPLPNLYPPPPVPASLPLLCPCPPPPASESVPLCGLHPSPASGSGQRELFCAPQATSPPLPSLVQTLSGGGGVEG